MDTTNLSIHTQGIPGASSNQALDIESRAYTYEDLIAYFKQHDGQSLSEQKLRQRLSTLKKFLEFLDKITGDKVGSELGGDFMPTLGRYVDACKKDEKSKGTIENYKTQLKQWRTVWEVFCSVEVAPKFDKLYQALDFYFRAAKAIDPTLVVTGVSRKAGFDESYITQAIRLKLNFPKQNSLKKITKLEEILGAPPTSLTSLAPIETESLTSLNAKKTGTTESGKLQKKAVEDVYRLINDDINEQLENEIKGFVRFKTSVTVAPLKRNQTWRLQPNKKYSGVASDLSLCSLDGKNFTSSGAKAISGLRSFFGCLIQLGYDPKNSVLPTWLIFLS